MGRTKGSVNVKTKQWAKLGSYITGKGAKRFATIMEGSSDEDFIKNYLQVIKYFRPAMASVDANVKGDTSITIKILGSAEEELDNL